MKKLACDACGRLYETLGSYGDDRWFVCLRCFEKADAMAAKEDRWPSGRDFARLKHDLAPSPTPSNASDETQ
jgi:hypothetical protein